MIPLLRVCVSLGSVLTGLVLHRIHVVLQPLAGQRVGTAQPVRRRTYLIELRMDASIILAHVEPVVDVRM